MKIDWIMFVSGCIALIGGLLILTASFILDIEWLILVGGLILLASGAFSFLRGTRKLLNSRKR